MSHKQIFDAIIVGAGVSGLALAQKIQKSGKTVLILEKSRSAGGRLATRRDEPALYDHGAQFLKELPLDLKTQYEDLFSSDLLKPWFQKEGLQYFSTVKGMNHLGKKLSQSLNIVFNEKVTQIESSSGRALLKTENNLEFQSRQVFLTAPLPQTLAILDQSRIGYPESLQEIQYGKALVLLTELSQGNLVTPYQQDVNENIFSISDQFSKKVSSVPAWTVTMSPAWSEKHFELSEPEIDSLIKSEIQKLPKAGIVQFKKSQVKKWRFSHPFKNYHQNYLQLEEHPEIILLGDGFGGGSIRGALQSAEDVFKAIFHPSK